MSDYKTRVETIVNGAMILSLASIITLIFSFIKESVVANYFGTTFAADAYVMAVDIPQTIFTFISMAIQTVVIPVYSKELIGKGKESAAYFISNFTTLALIIICAILICSEIFAGELVSVFLPGLEIEGNLLTEKLLRITLPATACAVLCRINIGVLSSHKEYFLPSLSTNIYNIVIIATIVFLNNYYGIYAAAVGTILGGILEYIYILFLKRKYHQYEFVIDTKNSATNDAIKMAIPVCIGMGAAEINKVVDKVIASFLSAGSISALHYASKVTTGISNILINTIATVTFPEMSECVARNDEKNAAKIYMTTLKLFFLLLIPITIGGICLGQEIITILYGRGNFDENSIKITTPIFAWYMICLTFTAIRQVTSRFFYSYGDSKTPMNNSLIGIVLNIFLNVILTRYFEAKGLAIATTLSTLAISVLLMKDIRKINKEIQYRSFIKSIKKIICSSTIMFVILCLFKYIAINFAGYRYSNLFEILIFTFASVFLGACSYLLSMVILKDEEFVGILKQIKAKIKNSK